MRVSPRWAPALLVCFLAVACGGSTGQSANDHNGSNPAPAAPGAPDQNGNAEAQGAPYKVPPYGRRGFPLETAKHDLEELFTTACGGNLCVSFSVEERQSAFENCRFYETDPPPGASFNREQTIVIVVGQDPCQPDTESPSPSTDIETPTVTPS